MTHKRGAVSATKIVSNPTTHKRKHEVPKALIFNTKVELRNSSEHVEAFGDGKSTKKAYRRKHSRKLEKEKPKLSKGEKKARAKAIGQTIAVRLVTFAEGANSKNMDAHFRFLGCCSVQIPKQGQMQTRYCNHRFCPSCGRIRAAKAIHDYLKPLESMGKPLWFVTLTRRAVSHDELKEVVYKMGRDFRRITDKYRKQGLTISGIRKFESNYNPEADTYNPHFHCLVSGVDEATKLWESWTEMYQERGDAESWAQQCKSTDDGTYMEVFKYMTKTYNTDKKTGDASMYPEAMDRLYTALSKRRTLQPFGALRSQKEAMPDDGQVMEEPIMEYATEVAKELIQQMPDIIFMWSQRDLDWVSYDHLVRLTGYKPTDADKRILNGLRKDKGGMGQNL